MRRKRKPKIHIKEELNRVLDEETDDMGMYKPKQRKEGEEVDFIEEMGKEVFFEESVQDTRKQTRGILRWFKRKERR